MFLDAYNAEIIGHPQFLENIQLDDVTHDYARLVPEPELGSMYFMLNQEPKRGAFKITLINLDSIGLARIRR